MDFWHDAAAQKRWLRRFALLTGVLLLPVLVLAVFARPSADDFIYAPAPMPWCSSTALTWRVCCGPRGTPTSTTMRTGRGSTFPALRWRFSRHLRQPILWCHAGLRAAAAVFLPVWAGTVRGAASGPAQRRLPWALALLLTFAFIEGMPAPVEGLYWFNGAMNYLPYFSLALLTPGWRLRSALPISCRPAAIFLCGSGLCVQSCHRRRASGGWAAERAGPAVGRGALRCAPP